MRNVFSQYEMGIYDKYKSLKNNNIKVGTFSALVNTYLKEISLWNYVRLI
ncbi:30S ribosomal protein S8, plastid (fragment) [Vibrio coralliirubri]